MKRWTVVLLALTMALSGLSIGCGGNETDKNKGKTPSGGGTKTPTSQPVQPGPGK